MNLINCFASFFYWLINSPLFEAVKWALNFCEDIIITLQSDVSQQNKINPNTEVALARMEITSVSFLICGHYCWFDGSKHPFYGLRQRVAGKTQFATVKAALTAANEKWDAKYSLNYNFTMIVKYHSRTEYTLINISCTYVLYIYDTSKSLHYLISLDWNM